MLNRLEIMKQALVADILGSSALDTLPFTLVQDRRQLPAAGAVYVVIDQEGRALYVGATTNLRRRWTGQHHCLPKVEAYTDARIVWKELSAECLEEAERALIYALDPLLNRTTAKDRQDAAGRTLALDPESEWVLDCFRPQEVARA